MFFVFLFASAVSDSTYVSGGLISFLFSVFKDFKIRYKIVFGFQKNMTANLCVFRSLVHFKSILYFKKIKLMILLIFFYNFNVLVSKKKYYYIFLNKIYF